MKKLFLVDAYALIFKYYYAFLGRPMRNRAGMNTSVVFGFVKFLRDIQKRERPDLLGVAFDPKGGSFRREVFPEYKANRAETPEDILLSVPYVKRVLEAMKMQSNYKVTSDCTVRDILVNEGDSVNANQVLIVLDIIKED